jgi:hypothetical protein
MPPPRDAAIIFAITAISYFAAITLPPLPYAIFAISSAITPPRHFFVFAAIITPLRHFHCLNTAAMPTFISIIDYAAATFSLTPPCRFSLAAASPIFAAAAMSAAIFRRFLMSSFSFFRFYDAPSFFFAARRHFRFAAMLFSLFADGFSADFDFAFDTAATPFAISSYCFHY